VEELDLCKCNATVDGRLSRSRLAFAPTKTEEKKIEDNLIEQSTNSIVDGKKFGLATLAELSRKSPANMASMTSQRAIRSGR
jgi:hypothetical protein